MKHHQAVGGYKQGLHSVGRLIIAISTAGFLDNKKYKENRIDDQQLDHQWRAARNEKFVEVLPSGIFEVFNAQHFFPQKL